MEAGKFECAMLFLIILIVFSGDFKNNGGIVAYSTDNGNSESLEDSSFTVEVTRELCHSNRPAVSIEYSTSVPSNYSFDLGNTIFLTCRNVVKGSTLHWKDTNGIQSGSILSDTDVALMLQITPDKNDIGLELTCSSVGPHGAMKTISLILQSNQECQNWGNSIKGVPMYLRRGEAYKANATCNGIAYYPNVRHSSKDVYTREIIANDFVIRNFSEEYIGTQLFCISYEIIKDTFSNMLNIRKRFDKSTIFKRVKRKITFYHGNEMKQRIEKTQVQTETTTEENSTDPPSSPVAIVGGVLGIIILLLILVLILIWYKKIRKKDSESMARVIYAEIEEKPSLPPPRRQDEPYAQIVGTLVPKDQTLSNEDHLYCIIK